MYNPIIKEMEIAQKRGFNNSAPKTSLHGLSIEFLEVRPVN